LSLLEDSVSPRGNSHLPGHVVDARQHADGHETTALGNKGPVASRPAIHEASRLTGSVATPKITGVPNPPFLPVLLKIDGAGSHATEPRNASLPAFDLQLQCPPLHCNVRSERRHPFRELAQELREREQVVSQLVYRARARGFLTRTNQALLIYDREEPRQLGPSATDGPDSTGVDRKPTRGPAHRQRCTVGGRAPADRHKARRIQGDIHRAGTWPAAG
jgi:hypothetical protein